MRKKEKKKIGGKMAKETKLDWGITAKKFAVNAVIVIIAGLASVYGENPYYLAIAPLLMAILNVLKHGTGISIVQKL